jgi:hypothetical protein
MSGYALVMIIPSRHIVNGWKIRPNAEILLFVVHSAIFGGSAALMDQTSQRKRGINVAYILIESPRQICESYY